MSSTSCFTANPNYVSNSLIIWSLGARVNWFLEHNLNLIFLRSGGSRLILGGKESRRTPAKWQEIIIINNKFNFSFTVTLLVFLMMLLHESNINSSGNNIFSHMMVAPLVTVDFVATKFRTWIDSWWLFMSVQQFSLSESAFAQTLELTR